MKIEMINTIKNILPLLGGAGGAASQINRLTEYLPNLETIIASIIITIIGAVTGYLVKILLDRIFKK